MKNHENKIETELKQNKKTKKTKNQKKQNENKIKDFTFFNEKVLKMGEKY